MDERTSNEEEARLAALDRYEILDTEPEEAFGHRVDRFLKFEGALIGVPIDLHSDEDREAEANTVASQRSSITHDVLFTFEPLDPPKARRRRQSNPVGKLHVAKPCVGLQFGDDPAVDSVQV